MSQSKKVACKREYLNKFLFIEKPLKCGLEKCRGAHNYEELTLSTEIKKFDSIEWKEVDFEEFYKIVFKQIKSAITNINKYPELLNMISKTSLNDMNFVETLNFWREFAVIMRREKRNFNEKDSRAKSFGYRNPGDIPTLDLKEYDAFGWSLWRSFHDCDQHEDFLNEVKKGTDKYDLQSKVCFHSVNCKNGTHHLHRQICSDDLLYGKCECKNSKQSQNHINKLNQQLKGIINRINKMVKYSIPKLANCDSKLYNLVIDARKKIVEIEKAHRKIHLSELGVEPIDEKTNKVRKDIVKPKAIIIFHNDDFKSLNKFHLVRGKFQF